MKRHDMLALHVCARQALLQLGARPDMKYRGQSPEEYAQRKQRRWGGYEDVLKAFEDMRSEKSLGCLWGMAISTTGMLTANFKCAEHWAEKYTAKLSFIQSTD